MSVEETNKGGVKSLQIRTNYCLHFLGCFVERPLSPGGNVHRRT